MQILQEIISTLETSRQFKNLQLHTVETLYPVGCGVIRMLRQRKNALRVFRDTRPRVVCVTTSHASHTRGRFTAWSSLSVLPLLLAFTHGSPTKPRASCTSLSSSNQSSLRAEYRTSKANSQLNATLKACDG